MSGYPGNLSAHQQEALEQFRQAIGDVKKHMHTDAFLLRWLRARDFDVAKAERMTSNSGEKNAVDDMPRRYEIPELVKENFPGTILHPCKDGRPMLLIPIRMDIKSIKAITDMLKMMEDHCPECLEKCVCINGECGILRR
ncbi:hypothetical protein MRX96_037289 [Rhipicephalus microplus]